MTLDTWKDMLADGKTGKVIAQMLDKLEEIGEDDYRDQVILISSRQKRLKKQLMNEEITGESANIGQNKINRSLIFTMEEMEDEDILTGEAAPVEDEAPPAKPIEKIDSLDELKAKAINLQKEIQFLKKEESFTLGGRPLFKLEESIKTVEAEYEAVKKRIMEFNKQEE